MDVAGLGAAVRNHPIFAPQGANVDFMKILDAQSLQVRTYERGVESETMACGTGIVACSLVAARLGKVAPPVRVACAGGNVLEVDFRPTDTGAQDVTLLGPAVFVFQGTLEYPSLIHPRQPAGE